MIKTIKNPRTAEEIKAISSKSEVHRLLICAALGNRKTVIRCENLNEDITATAECLKALSAEITYENSEFTVTPIKEVPENPILPCNESGSTLRFLLPVSATLGKGAVFCPEGRLYDRPLSPLKEELEKAGITIEKKNGKIYVSGKTEKTDFTIAGNVSSQFISGLMFMLSFTGGTITITEKTESRPYIEMTAQALRIFGCKTDFSENKITVSKTYPLVSPTKAESFGDWSNAAFFLTAGAIGKNPITVSGLDINSFQGDKEIINVLRSFGAKIEISDNKVTSFPSVLHGIEINGANIPDLIPVLSVAAVNAKGTTKIYNCERLRLKESDRIEAVREMLSSLGADVEINNDDIIINGSSFKGGTVNSHNDHRIAMSAAVAAFSTDNEITVVQAEAVNKSYPSFWDEIR